MQGINFPSGDAFSSPSNTLSKMEAVSAAADCHGSRLSGSELILILTTEVVFRSLPVQAKNKKTEVIINNTYLLMCAIIH